jgi:hypothetical protein
MTIRPRKFKLARSANEIAERMNCLQQDYRSGILAPKTEFWLNYQQEIFARQLVLVRGYNPDEVEDYALNASYPDAIRYAALAESMWLYGVKDSVHVPLPGTSYSTESYL